jgi:hypothetical protein
MSLDLRDLDGIPDPLAGRALPPLPPPPALPKEASPTHGTLRRRRIVALAIGAAWMIAIVAFFGLRGDLAPSPLVLAHVGLPAVLGAAALFAALSGGPAGLGPSSRVTLVLALAGPLAFVVTAAMFATHDSGAGLAKGIFICGDIVLLLGAVPLAALTWAARRTCVTGAPWRSALLAIAIGLAGATALGMHCNITDGLHVALGHGWPILALGVIGWGLVRRVTRA